MKNSILIMLVMFSMHSAWSQIEEKSWVAGASLGLADYTSSDKMDLVINPKIGYQVLDKLMLIGEFNYLKEVTSNGIALEETKLSNQHLLGAGIRYLIAEKPICGTLFLGSSFHHDLSTGDNVWLITPGLYYDYNSFLLELSFDVTAIELLNNEANNFISVEIGVSMKL